MFTCMQMKSIIKAGNNMFQDLINAPRTLQTSSSTFNLKIKRTFNNLPASFRRLATFCGSILLVNGSFVN